MTKRDDGGPAYPIMWDYAENETGMSLRDWFATHADTTSVEFPDMPSLCEFLGVDEPQTAQQVLLVGARAAAKIRYMYADAMLEERKK